MAPNKSLAAEIEAVLGKRLHVSLTPAAGGPSAKIVGIPEAAAEIAALQSRAFEDGARWRRTGKTSRPAFGSGGTDEWFRPSDGLLRDFPVSFEPNLGAYYGLKIDFSAGRAALAEQEKGDA